MGDVGDYWNESRGERREARSLWLQCACGRKVQPGVPCPDCGRMEDPQVAESKARRAANREGSARILTERGVPFVSKNNGAHLIVDDRFDLWPGTGLWVERGVREPKLEGRGVFNLLEKIEVKR